MNRQEPNALYNDNWDKEFTTMDDLFARIKFLATHGAYSMCVYVDSKNTYDEVYVELRSAGYDVEHYNGGNNGIIEVSWG